MNITQVKIFPVEEEKLKAFVSIVFDHCFMVNDIKVIQGKDGLFLSMPSRRKKSGEFKDVAHPLNNETRRHIEETVLNEYRSMVDDPTPRRPDREDDAAVADMAPPPRVGGSNGSSRPEAPPAEVVRAESPPPSRPEPRPWSPPAASTGSDAAPAQIAKSVQLEERADEAVEGGERSLEEVQEKHLRDSFWTVS